MSVARPRPVTLGSCRRVRKRFLPSHGDTSHFTPAGPLADTHNPCSPGVAASPASAAPPPGPPRSHRCYCCRHCYCCPSCPGGWGPGRVQAACEDASKRSGPNMHMHMHAHIHTVCTHDSSEDHAQCACCACVHPAGLPPRRHPACLQESSSSPGLSGRAATTPRPLPAAYRPMGAAARVLTGQRVATRPGPTNSTLPAHCTVTGACKLPRVSGAPLCPTTHKPGIDMSCSGGGGGPRGGPPVAPTLPLLLAGPCPGIAAA